MAQTNWIAKGFSLGILFSMLGGTLWLATQTSNSLF